MVALAAPILWAVLSVPNKDAVGVFHFEYLTVSLFSILAAALLEEVAFRVLFIDSARKIGVNLSFAIIFQSLIFTVAHGRLAQRTLDELLWFATIGIFLGCAYAAWGILSSTVLHCWINVLVSQAERPNEWYAGQIFASVPQAWKGLCMLAMALLSAGMVIALRRNAVRKTRTS
ncbi:CPBP family intramembrane glutamic endopeptidase [Pelomonas sp. BJYL3]|uniref:CPBP family intramembrane glutamic endopeptidase n=1 Tax=Pelomonas sp. BJYL3 TaxID=2976697 RepID=UPI0022B49795|nr:CPBP family intramembrane glutamic endopeptidase [Pelomonas sp. BJYL3]